jgi:hypothetical protein
MPYNDRDFTSQPSDAASARALRYKIDSNKVACLAYRPDKPLNIEALKTYLAECRRPFPMSFWVFEDFQSQSHVDANYVYNHTTGKGLGGHCLAVIGYDDDLHALRIRNSWGPQWGDNGDLWISEDYATQNYRDAWGFVPGGPVARGGHVHVDYPAGGTK